MPTSSRTTELNSPVDITALLPTLDAVRTNCHISDAQHAADYTLCVYLLKMREYFRWEHGIPYSETLPQKDLTAWLAARETHWQSLEGRVFEEVPVLDSAHNPFAADTINQALNSLGYVYSSGYGRNMKPLFFLGELERLEQYSDFTVVVSGKEYARDLASPPAMSQGKTIYIRRESLRRMLWEKVEEWRWNKPANAMQQALDCYDFDGSAEESLNAMTENELQAAILHEIGEVRAGDRLGDSWENMLAAMPHSKAELMIRAVRDNLADALSTLPGLLSAENPASLHFFMANMTSMRKSLFPKLQPAYESWIQTGDTSELRALTGQAETHWQSLADEILVIFNREGAECRENIVSTIEQNIL